MSFENRAANWYKKMLELSKIKKGMEVYPSPPDPRDYHEPLIAATQLPATVILPIAPPVLNQGREPYCGGASGAGCGNGFYSSEGTLPDESGFSMTFLYWLAKQYDGIPNLEGTYLRVICKIMEKYGCAPEFTQPFSSVKHPNINNLAYAIAKNYKVESYYRVMTIHDIKTALSRGRYVLLATFLTSTNWGWGSKGWISYPSGDFMGGHATYLYGYDNSLSNKHNGYFLGMNSWGGNWGDGGKFYLPYDYFNMKLPSGMDKFIEAWSLKFKPAEPEKDSKIETTNPWVIYRDLHNTKKKLWSK